MRLINLLLDNWWLLFFVYGIIRFLTKAKRAAATAAERKAAIANRTSVARAEEATTDDSDRSWKSVSADFDDDENKRIYGFTSPVSDEEVKDAAERLRAFAFVDADTLPAPTAKETAAARAKQDSTDLDRLPYLTQVAGVPSGATYGMTFTADDMRRAFIYSEILSSPRSKRPLR